MAYDDNRRAGTARPVAVPASDLQSRILTRMTEAVRSSERASRILTISTFHPRRYVVRTGRIGYSADPARNGRSHG